MLVLGCGEAVGTGGSPASLGEVSARLALLPSAAPLGVSQELTVKGVSTSFDARTEVSLGAGVVVTSVEAISPYELLVRAFFEQDALPGYRDLTVTGPDGALTLEDALLLQAGSLSVSPTQADRGQSLRALLQVEGMDIEPGFTFAEFGEGIVATDFEPLSASEAYVTLNIASDAAAGPRDVTLSNGPRRLLLPGGFNVERGLVAIRFDPPVVSQGVEELDFVITGTGTHFEAGLTQVNFGVGILLDDSDPASLIVEGPTRISGRVKICRGAVPGVHDVSVSTTYEDGRFERVSAVDAVTVEEVPAAVEDGYASFSLVYVRSWVDGRLEESVSASGVFQVVAGACGTSNGTGCPTEATSPNQPSYYPPQGCTPVSNTNLFPPSPSLDAGPYVFIEGPGGTPSIRLDKELDSDGTFYYAPSQELGLEVFIPNTAYSVRIPGGDGVGAVPEGVIQRAIVTPPSLFTVVSPDLAYAPTLNPYDSVSVQWIDDQGAPGAHTFPVANLSMRMQTLGVEDGSLTRVDVRQIIPDSGVLTLPATAVSFLAPGVGSLSMTASRVGDVYTLPGSRYATYSTSAVVTSGLFELRE